MHFFLMVGIALAAGVVGFALQNNMLVTVSVALWQFEGSLALVLLVAMGLGVLAAGLLSSPTLIRNRWARSRLQGQVLRLEQDKAALGRRIAELEAELEKLAPRLVREEPVRFPGLQSLFLDNPGKSSE